MDGESLRENLNSLPEEIREAVIQLDFNEIIDRIAWEQSLSEGQIEIFDHDATSALVGAIHPNKLSDYLQESEENIISPEKASELHVDFYARMLAPTMQEAENRGFSFFEQGKEVDFDALQSKEDLIRMGSKYYEAATESVRDLTEEQSAFFQNHISERTDLLSQGCPCCGSTQFELMSSLKYIPTASPGGQVNLEFGAPYFEITCSNCKSSQLFNAFIIDAPGMNP